MGEIRILKGWFKKSGMRQGRRVGDYANVDAVAAVRGAADEMAAVAVQGDCALGTITSQTLPLTEARSASGES